MKTLLLTAPEKKAKPENIRKLVPGEFSGWRIEAIPSGSLGGSTISPDVTVVEIDEDTKPAEVKSMIPDLVEMQGKGPQPSYVVFSFKDYPKAKPAEARAQLRCYQNVMTQITGSLPAFPSPQLVDVTFASSPSAVATLLEYVRAQLDLPVRPTRARPSPLDQVKQVVEASRDLRVADGNISAERVAKLYNVSLSELARWFGKSRQAVTKTPDADSLQPALSFFERVARVRLALKTDADFRKWLRTPHALLENKSPLQLMAKGEWQVMADFVDDALTGAPT